MSQSTFDRSGLATRELLQHLVRAAPSQYALPEALPDAAALASWQHVLRAALWEVLGVPADQAGQTGQEVPAEIGEAHHEDGYTRQQVYYRGAFGGTVSALLLTPDPLPATPAPGVLCLHGHGGNLGKELVAGVAGSEDAAAIIARHNYDFAAAFARRGYVTLAPDALGFGERAPDKSAGYHTAMGLVSEYLGHSLTGLRLLDDSRGLSVLAALPAVDASRLGAAGLSEGGKRALFLAALDQRVAAAVVSGYFTTLRQEVQGWERLRGWDLCNHLFGLLRVCDLPDVAALVAPRPLLIQNGRQDPLYGVSEAEGGFRTVQRAYSAAGAAEGCSLDLFDGEHVFMPAPAAAWLDRWLRAR